MKEKLRPDDRRVYQMKYPALVSLRIEIEKNRLTCAYPPDRRVWKDQRPRRPPSLPSGLCWDS